MAYLLRSHHLGLRNYPVSYRHSADCQAEYVKYSAVWEPCQSPVTSCQLPLVTTLVPSHPPPTDR